MLAKYRDELLLNSHNEKSKWTNNYDFYYYKAHNVDKKFESSKDIASKIYPILFWKSKKNIQVFTTDEKLLENPSLINSITQHIQNKKANISIILNTEDKKIQLPTEVTSLLKEYNDKITLRVCEYEWEVPFYYDKDFILFDNKMYIEWNLNNTTDTEINFNDKEKVGHLKLNFEILRKKLKNIL